MPPRFSKPKDQKRVTPTALIVYRDKREECNLHTQEGRDIYNQRKRIMWDRQDHICCLYGHIPGCPGRLSFSDAEFDHEIPRGHGGGSQDDRIVIPVKQKDGTIKIRWQNGAAHHICNGLKGSRRINYNAERNGDIIWELIPKFTRSGKVLFRCPGCGCETPAPTKNHQCHKEEM